MTLRQQQAKFAHMVALLILFAEQRGYEVTISHVLRCEDCPVGAKRSLHKLKLAIDLNLFRNGKYLSSTEAHRPLGEFWESIGGSWGGRFTKKVIENGSEKTVPNPDGNHYSLEWQGRK